jgi:hypothetical protein
VSKTLITFSVDNCMNINISVYQMVLTVSRLLLRKEISAVIEKRTLYF